MSGQTNGTCHVKRQADVMQNGTDAGLVPGRRQNTMGLETSLGETFKRYVLSDRTPQSMDKFSPPRGQNSEQQAGHSFFFFRKNKQIHNFWLDLTDIRERKFTFYGIRNTYNKYIQMKRQISRRL